jgi:hypothetical protein
MLRTLRPDVHFIPGEKSPISFPVIRKPDLNRVEQRQEEVAVLKKNPRRLFGFGDDRMESS